MIEQNELPGQQEYEQGDVFPLLYLAGSEVAGSDLQRACAWVETNREELAAQLNACGAILLRDFGINNDHDFDQ